MAKEKEEKKPLNKGNLKKLLGIFQFMYPYRWLFFTGLLCLFISSFLVLSFPVLSGKLLDVASGEKWVMSSGDLLDQVQGGEIVLENVTQVAFLLMGILIVQSGFSFIRVYLFAIVSEKSMADLRKTVFNRILNLPMTYFDNRRVGDLISRLTSDVSIIQETFSITAAELFRQTTVLLIGVGIIFVIVPKLSLFMLAIFPAIIILTLFFGRSIRRLSKDSQTSLGNTNVILEETLQSVLIVKAFTNEFYEIGRYGKQMGKTVKIALRAAKYRGFFISFIVFALFGAIVAVMWQGGSLVAEGVISAGDLVTFVLVTMFIGASIAGLGDMYGQLQRAIGASERVMEILKEDQEEDIEDGVETEVQGNIEFRDVSFTYPESKEQILSELNFKIDPGQKLALVGPSGAGKSTITQLLMRFYPLSEGQILVDDHEVHDYSLSYYRKNIGIVPQEIILFGGTIRENIGYGKPGATDEEIEEAARQANALEFIEGFENGMETIVGERGVKLSGGQRQRIAIARAILKDPAILILDEATSSLDAQSEVLVQEALEKLMEGRTTLVIAHRLSTIRRVDQILVINKGTVIEKGTHEELSAIPDGMYSHLLKLQFQLN